MKRHGIAFRTLFGGALSAAALSLGACATAPSPAEASEQWAANGYFGALRSEDPRVIGVYRDKTACIAALEAWLATQVVGMPVTGECLPVDRD